MKLMKTVKKIMALGTGAVMVGATVLSASAAADLAKYPVPFVKDGKFNGLFVVGDSANAADVLGSVDIATSLQFAARVKKTVQTSAAGTVSVSGEAWRVGTSAKKLEFSESLGSGASSAKQETIRNITTFVTDDELPTLLADGTFRNSKGDYDYHQYIYFDPVNTQTTTASASLSVIYAEDPDSDVTADYFYVKNSDRVARYSLEFTTSAESTITDSAGTASSTGTFYWSYEGKDINMLGKTYSIVKARRTSSAAVNSAELTLMGGAKKDTLAEGESKTYTVGGKDYDVTLDFVGSTTAKFTVNSELTDSLNEGDTFTLSDKSLIGVKDILVQDFAGGVRSVEFYVGANKIFLKDTDVSGGAGSQSLEVGSIKVDDTKAIITGSNDNSTFKIDTIQLNISADDDLYVPAGGKLSVQMEKPDALWGAWDFEYQGLENVATEKVKISRSGSNQYDLVFTNGDGNEISVPLAYTSGGTNLSLGDNTNALVLTENTTIARNDYFIVTDISQQQGDRRTYAIRYKGASAFGDSTPVVKFQVLGDSTTKEETLTNSAGDAGIGTADAVLKLGGATYNVWNSSLGTADFNIMVDLNGNGVVDAAGIGNATGTPAVNLPVNTGNIMNVTTKSGAQIVVQPFPTNSSYLKLSGAVPMIAINVSVQTPNADDYDNLAPTPVAVDITAASGKVQFSENIAAGDHNYLSPQGESNTNYVYTTMGAKVKWDNPSNDPDTLDIDYPVVQRLPLVYITAPGAEISTGEASEGGQIVYYETTPISVGTAKLAGEVTNLAAQNAIVVGGPCANAAAAEVMGMPTPCGKDFSVGKAMIKLYEQANGNVAMLVAGYDAADTRRAARVVANYAQWQDSGKLKGTEVEVSGTSFTDISVAAPAPKPVAAAPAPVAETTPAATTPAATTPTQ